MQLGVLAAKNSRRVLQSKHAPLNLVNTSLKVLGASPLR